MCLCFFWVVPCHPMLVLHWSWVMTPSMKLIINHLLMPHRWEKNFIDKIFFRSTYLQLPIFNHCSSMITNIVSTNILEVFAILCWFSTWTLTDVIMEMMTSNIIINVAISLTVGTISGLLAYILQIPLFYNLK